MSDSDLEVHIQGRFDWEKIIRRIVFPPKYRAAKNVAMMLASFADADSGERVRPGEERLAAICQLGVSTVRACLKWLRDHHLIYRRERGSNLGVRNKADVYVLCAPKDWETRFTVLPDWEKDSGLVIPKPRRRNPNPLGTRRFDVDTDRQDHRQRLADDEAGFDSWEDPWARAGG